MKIKKQIPTATYYQFEPEAHVVILDKDSLRKSASLIKYFVDGKVNTEALDIAKYNEFKTKFTGKEISIAATKVNTIYKSGGSGF